MKITIIESNASTGGRETKSLDVPSEGRIPVQLQGNIQITRDGEPPASVTKTADGVVVRPDVPPDVVAAVAREVLAGTGAGVASAGATR